MPMKKLEQVDRGLLSRKDRDRVDRGSLKWNDRGDPALLEAFERELTPDVARRLLELAARRTAMLRAAGVAVASDEAKLLVQEALTETLAQIERWEPGESTLAAHLTGVVRRRSWAKLAQARKLRALAIEVVTGGRPREATNDAAGDAVVATTDTTSSSGERAGATSIPGEPAQPGFLPIWRHGARELVQRVLASLSETSAEDAAVRLILEAFCDGAATRAQVLAASGLSVEAYASARRRLDRILAGMPAPSLESPVSALWRAR